MKARTARFYPAEAEGAGGAADASCRLADRHGSGAAQGLASLTLTGSRTFSVVGATGNSVRVEFRATEWDEQIVIFPPSIRWVRDGDMNNRSNSITHSFNGSSFSGLGNRSITLVSDWTW